MSKLQHHLSYANVVATLALFLVVGGATAWAAKKHTQKIGTTQIKASAITTAKIKNTAVDNSKLKDGAVTGSKLSDGSVSNAKLEDGSVSTSKLAGDAVTGDKVAEATLSEVPSANSANPAVFAHVNANGIVDAANSKGLTSPNVTKQGPGTYCLSVSSFAPRGAQVTAQANGTTPTFANVTIGGPSCPGSAVQVLTFSASALTDLGFYVEVYH